MIQYTFFQKNPHAHYVYIDMLVETNAEPFIELQLSSWRPGRYELGNFAKNIKKTEFFNEHHEPLPFTKLTKDLWKVETKGCKQVKATYSYYAAELNAGACFANHEQLYINPVHCCFQVKGQEQVTHKLILNIPEHYKIASSLKTIGKELYAANYEELVDSPFIAAATLQSTTYQCNGILFHLHFCGYCQPDFEKLKQDFEKFTSYQIAFWGSFPVNEYHFLFQITPFKFYHGVEHQKNTVIAIGPGYALHSPAVYEDVLGVSCHELFHTWNIKYIRPAEMLPYNYSKENYARTGYVYEGFTTYYGDKHLLCSGVFSNEQYFKTLEERLQKHFHNFGRYNLSVADSSWDTWLDGYVPGAPYRKTNIYDEGNLIALILDTEIMKASGNEKTLKHVCRLLYERFGKRGKGYTEQDIIQLVNEVAGSDLSHVFTNYVYAAADYEPALTNAFNYLGITFHKADAPQFNEHAFGFKAIDNGTFSKVSLVAPYSPAWKAGLFNGDEIIAVNGRVIRNNLSQWLVYFQNEDCIRLSVIKNEALEEILLTKDKKGTTWFATFRLSIADNVPDEAKTAFNVWLQN